MNHWDIDFGKMGFAGRAASVVRSCTRSKMEQRRSVLLSRTRLVNVACKIAPQMNCMETVRKQTKNFSLRVGLQSATIHTVLLN